MQRLKLEIRSEVANRIPASNEVVGGECADWPLDPQLPVPDVL
jgi:hypothetical protein